MNFISALVLIFFAIIPTGHAATTDNDSCNTLGLHVVDYASNGVEGVWVDLVEPGCLGDLMGIQTFDIVITANGEAVASEFKFHELLRSNTFGDKLEMEIYRQGVKHTLKYEPALTQDEYANTYPSVKQTGNHFGFWFKRILIFSAAFMLIPIGLAIMQDRPLLAGIIAAGAIHGAIEAKGNKAHGAFQGAITTLSILLFITFIGPIGLFYSFHRIAMAYSSDADKTWCCLYSFPMIGNVGMMDISGDGRWLLNVVETPNTYLGLGDRLLEEKHMLSIMDLDTGKFVKWPSTKSMWHGFNVRPSNIEIEDAVYVMEETYTQEPYWQGIPLDVQFLGRNDFKHGQDLQVAYRSLGMTGGVFSFEDTLTGEVKQVVTNQAPSSYKQTRLSLTSHDGRVLATAKAYYDHKDTDGIVTDVFKMFANWLIQPWEIQFWNIEDGSLIATYKGHGIDADSIDPPDMRNENRFLDSSADGRRWFMTKDDGYVHVFDLSAKVPPAKMKLPVHFQRGIIDSQPATGLQVMHNSGFETETYLAGLESLLGMSSHEILGSPELTRHVAASLGDSILETVASMEYSSLITKLEDGSYVLTFCRIPSCERNGMVLSIQDSGLTEVLIYDIERTMTQLEGNRYVWLSNSPFIRTISLPLRDHLFYKFGIDMEGLYQNGLLANYGSLNRQQI